MSLAVVNYPRFAEEDFNWIQSVRQKYDRLYFDVIGPHFPLVFPTEAVTEEELTEHVRQCIAGASAFEVVFRCVVLGDPDFQGHAHAFQVPDEGFSDIVRLHDRLYTGVLRNELRLDLPFLPHVGIANAPAPEECKDIVDQLNREHFEIRGRVETLDIIGFDGKRVWTIEQLKLGN